MFLFGKTYVLTSYFACSRFLSVPVMHTMGASARRREESMSHISKSLTKGALAIGTALSATCMLGACSATPQDMMTDGDETVQASDKVVAPIVMDAQAVGSQGIIVGRFSVERETEMVMRPDMTEGRLGAELKSVDEHKVVWEGEADAETNQEVTFTVDAGDYYVIASGHGTHSYGTVTIESVE